MPTLSLAFHGCGMFRRLASSVLQTCFRAVHAEQEGPFSQCEYILLLTAERAR